MGIMILLLLGIQILSPHYIYLGPVQDQLDYDFPLPPGIDPNEPCKPDEWNLWQVSCNARVQDVL